MKKLALAGLLGIVVGIMGWGGFNTALEATNGMPFCISCHVMRDTVYAEYQQSVHYQNPSGVRATCPDCHVPRDWTHKLLRKVQASNELYHWLAGSIDTMEKFEAKRHSLAVREWERMRANDSRECRNCHSFEAMAFHKQSIKAARTMREAAQTGKTCIDCHKAVAHKMPDVTAVYRKMFAALVSEAAKVVLAPGDLVSAMESRPLHADRGGAVVGELLAGSPIRVLAVDGAFAQVEFIGWQREGDPIFYARLGQRIARARLDEPVLAGLDVMGTAEDPDTGQTWSETRLHAWVPVTGFLRDPEPLWRYADRMHRDNCTLCHPIHPPQAYAANAWIGHLNSMKRLTPLSEQEAGILLAYLQMNGKDGAR